MFVFGKKKRTTKEILSDYFIITKEDAKNLFEGKVLLNKEYDFDNLYAYNVKSLVEKNNEILLTLCKDNLVGEIRFCENLDGNEKSEGTYRFSQIVNGRVVAALKKNELLFTADKLGE
jgi:hypothetical protein